MVQIVIFNNLLIVFLISLMQLFQIFGLLSPTNKMKENTMQSKGIKREFIRHKCPVSRRAGNRQTSPGSRGLTSIFWSNRVIRLVKTVPESCAHCAITCWSVRTAVDVEEKGALCSSPAPLRRDSCQPFLNPLGHFTVVLLEGLMEESSKGIKVGSLTLLWLWSRGWESVSTWWAPKPPAETCS